MKKEDKILISALLILFVTVISFNLIDEGNLVTSYSMKNVYEESEASMLTDHIITSTPKKTILSIIGGLAIILVLLFTIPYLFIGLSFFKKILKKKEPKK